MSEFDDSMKMDVRWLVLMAGCAGLLVPGVSGAEAKIRVLLIDGQNNHNWQETTPVLVEVLENSGRFTVEVSTSPAGPPKGPRKPNTEDAAVLQAYQDELKAWMAEIEAVKAASAGLWATWRPAFADYDVVVSNYNGEPWPREVEEAFEAYVSGGGGFVSVHAANNSFPQWKAYNEMIAVGGWGGRSELSGPYLRLRDGGMVQDMSPGKGGSHGKRHAFVVETRSPEHPIVAGLPARWMHTEDELYDRLRGPAENVTVLATAFADPATGGSGEHEPMLMVIDYGQGRVFHTTLGHDAVAMSGRGFRETLVRGTEWAATGDVSFPGVPSAELPDDRAAVAME